jgi:hypothetical protein
MGLDLSELAKIPVMSYSSAHHTLSLLDNQLKTIRKPFQGNEITAHFQKIEDYLIKDLDDMTRPIPAMPLPCLVLALLSLQRQPFKRQSSLRLVNIGRTEIFISN